MSIYLRSVLAWFGLLGVVVAVGALREGGIAPWLGEPYAHRLGTLLACAAVFACTLAFVRRATPSARDAWRIGLLWLGLSLLFEIGFFHVVMGHPWRELLADYDLRRGRLLILLWLTVLIGPYAAVRLIGGPRR